MEAVRWAEVNLENRGVQVQDSGGGAAQLRGSWGGSDRSEVVRLLESRRARATVCQSEGCPVKELSVLSKRNRD